MHSTITNHNQSQNKLFVFHIVTKDATPITQSKRKSQRFIEVDERLNNDMQVTESMQNFMHKKLNQIIEKRIEFVTIASPPVEERTTSDDVQPMVRLFRDSAPINLTEESNNEPSTTATKQKRRKTIKRRFPEEDGLIEADRLAGVVVSTEDIQREVSAWTKPVNNKKLFEYVAHKYKKQLHVKEADNEFTSMRKKNNWSENKIATK